MANELGIYTLFRNILNQSMVIGGRFFVLKDNQMNDVNAENFGDVVKDAFDGYTSARKYPACIMTPPTEKQAVGERGQPIMHVRMYFVTKQGQTGDGSIKAMNPNTITSEHTKEMDWKDMRECAANFYKVLRELIRKPPLSQQLGECRTGMITYSRVAARGNDNLNGVELTFELMYSDDNCVTADYADISAILIPETLSPHPLHKQ